jgi:transaldolase
MKHSEIAAGGTSIWLDDLSRAKISGVDAHSLPHRIAHDGVVGVTTNPSIFGAAISGSQEYAADIAELKGKSAQEIVQKLTTDDVRSACDLFAPIFLSSSGVDGRVSIEVDPRLSAKTDETVLEGLALYNLVNRPNVMIKVPATLAGLPAITSLISHGVSVNVTLIFSLKRYGQVIDAFMLGLEQAMTAGRDISEIHSVASFFISRIDSSVDKELKVIGNTSLLGKVAIANAHLAYDRYQQELKSPRWQKIVGSGGNMQRPLWASTGVKDPAYSDTQYVTHLIAPNTVNTMPQGTLDAVLDHGVFITDSITSEIENSQRVIEALAATGISLAAITDELEIDGVKKFEDAWVALLTSVAEVSKL